MVNTNKRRIVLIPANTRAATIFLRDYDAKNFNYWIYLGKHATRYTDINKVIGNTIKRKEIGEELQNSAGVNRQKYINFIGDLVISEKNPFWYLTSLSEKNPYVSNFFLNFCYLHVIIKIISNSQYSICVFCESGALITSIEKNLETNPELEVISLTQPISVFYNQFISVISLIKNKIWFSVRFLSRILYVKVIRDRRKKEENFHEEQSSIVIHSWTDQRSFSEIGKYRDVYFGDLGKRLQHNCQSVYNFIDILPTIWYPIAVKKVRLSGVRGFLLEDFLDFSDVFSSIIRVHRQKKWISHTFSLSGLNVSDLVNEEKTQDYVNARAEQSYLCYCAGKKMCQSIRVMSFIYTFENHIWEKMFIEGIRNVCRKTDIIGYAHSTVNRMELSYSVSRMEKNFAPLPDKILVNGIHAKRLLVESGFDSIQIEISGAIRYQGLLTYHHVRNSDKKNRILVVLSADIDRSVEMILKITEAFKDIENVRVTFKPHPILKCSIYSHYTSYLPNSFSFTSDSIQELFEKTDLVLYSDSTASVEAAAHGIPLLHIKSNFSIDSNIFEDANVIPSANSPDQIRSIAMKILNNDVFPSDVIQNVIRELFAPVDEQKILSAILTHRVS